MISLQTWLTQIIGYCHFVVNEAGMRRAWIESDFSNTSVTNFDELYEQIFDDLDSDAFETILNSDPAKDESTRKALSAFLNAIRCADDTRERRVELASPENLLNSDEWHQVVAAAELVIRIFEGAGDDPDCDKMRS